MRRRQGCPSLVHLGLPSPRCSRNSGNLRRRTHGRRIYGQIPGLVAARPQGNDRAEDTPPAGPMIRDEHAMSPPSPAAPVANLDLSTPAKTIEQPSHTTQLPPSTNVALTQPPASVTPPAPGSSIQSSEHTPENTPSAHELRRSGRRRPRGK